LAQQASTLVMRLILALVLFSSLTLVRSSIHWAHYQAIPPNRPILRR